MMFKTSLLPILVALLLPFGSMAGEKVVVSQWLSTGPLDVHYPAFHETPNIEGQAFSDRQLLMFDHFDLNDYYPEAGKDLIWLDGNSYAWLAETTDAEGFVAVADHPSGDEPQVAYLATYIRTDRWIKAQLEMRSPYLFEAWLNGTKIGTKSTMEGNVHNDDAGNGDSSNDGNQDEPHGSDEGVALDRGADEGNSDAADEDHEEMRGRYGRVGHQVELPRGKHLLVIKLMRPPQADTPWEMQASISYDEPFTANDIQPGISPETIKDILHFMDGVKVTTVRPSPDGSMYAVGYRRSLPPTDRTETWTDIHRTEDDALVHSYRHASVSRLTWLPASNAVSYTTVQNGRTTVHLHNLETGRKQVLMEDVEDFAGKRWSPDENTIIYNIREEGSGMDASMRHILGMQDRQDHFRHRSFLYRLDVATGVRTRLTHGSLTTSLHDISPDGRQIVFSQTRPDYLERPYFKHDLFMMDLQTLDTDTLLADKRWSVSTSFSPDGQYLLATGGPSAFDRIGENIPEGMIANNYDTQAYIYRLSDGHVEPITIDFDPTVASVHWHAVDDYIYILAGERDYRRLYRYDTGRERFELLDAGLDFISNVQFASQARVAAYVGNEVNAPPRAHRMNLRRDSHEVLVDTDAERYRHVQFGEVVDWEFTASVTGKTIDGRYYLPPDFDPEQSYPVIVYQYGGTNPVGRTFGHRYPFNLWAGNGYIVYVLQPSGATGYGQEFSAAHVNNWGKTVADEIIEGTEKFLEAHPFADPERVGVAGASYGGFMTMLLLTHTDLFATGISHAGISNIASYWGEGYWGFSYSAEATANKFPWNSREVYVDQSPLYRADHVNTPLLLITGDSDTNVPPGESIQMYTALKLLGKPVELILVEGEDHHIVTYNRRLEWHDAFMAWWDKYLKDQPEWWDEQYPEKNY